MQRVQVKGPVIYMALIAMLRILKLSLVLTLAFSMTSFSVLRAEQAQREVLFYFIEKYVRYQQTGKDELVTDVYGFESLIFRVGEGRVNQPRIMLPKGKNQVSLKDGGRVYIINDGSYPTLAALNQQYPDGSYYMSFTTPQRSVQKQAVNLNGKGNEADYPPTPRIALWQEGKKTSPKAIDVNKNLTVTWSPFTTARTDPNHILDDFILLLLEDCKENLLNSSGLPFTDHYLRANNTAYTYNAGSLLSGSAYTLEVEHLRMSDTVISEDIPGLGVYATITRVDIQTTGKERASPCSQ